MLSKWRLILVQFLITTSVSANPIYVYKESDGTIRFTNKPPPANVQAKVFEARKAGFSTYSVRQGYRAGRLQPTKYLNLILEACSKFSLERSLVQAVIHVESGFNPKAVSAKGALGLMQLMPATARDRGVKNALEPAQNIHGGTEHLAFLVRKYDGNLRLALAAYNAGAEAVDKYGGIPPYDETVQYVRRVLELKGRYGRSSYG